MCAHTCAHTPALNHNHFCRERKSERSAVAKSQNALHFSLRNINQFWPAWHNLPRGWFQSKKHEGFPKRHQCFSLCPGSCWDSYLMNILTAETKWWRLLYYYQSKQFIAHRRATNCISSLLLSTSLSASNSAILQNNVLWKGTSEKQSSATEVN